MQVLSYARPRALLALFFLTSCLIIDIISRVRGIQIDYVSFLPFFQVALMFYLSALVLFFFGRRSIAMLCECTAFVLAFITPVFLSTFLAISMGAPLADAWLIGADEALGFDWVAYIHAIDQHAWLIEFYTFVYGTFYLLILFVPLLLVVYREVGRAYGFIFGFGFLCFVSSLISIWFPSMGAFHSHGVRAEDLQHMVPVVGYGFLEQFGIAYGGNLTEISVDNISGILTFPSVHAGVAFWVIWSARALPLIGWPIGLLSFSMAISAISHGSHYLVDILAGLGVACLTAMVVQALFLQPWPFSGRLSWARLAGSQHDAFARREAGASRQQM